MFLAMLLLVIIILINTYFTNDPITLGTYRLLMVMGVNVLIFFLTCKSFFLISKIILVFIPGFFLIILPAIYNFVEVQSFIYYPIIILGLSLLPQIIFIPKFDKFIFWFSMICYFILIFFLFEFLSFFSPERFVIIDIISDFLIYYKIVPIFVYVFIQASMFYFRSLNVNYENELLRANKDLNFAIDELKITQQYLVQSEKMASLGTLTYGVAHEINNPLNYINGGLQMVMNTYNKIENFTNEEIKERFTDISEIIGSGVKKISDIVNSLMDFSDRGEPVIKSSNIEILIDKVITFLNFKISEDIEIKKEYSIEKKVPIFQAKFIQVIHNILENAIIAVQSNKTEKHIKIKTYISEENAEIVIFNNGPNIPEEIFTKIFDPFFTTRDPGQGTGLGLSICYSLISDHDGVIMAKNVDHGVEFVIKLPLK